MLDNQLNTNEYLQQCNPKDVISFNSEKWISVGKIKEIINKSFFEYGLDFIVNQISNISYLKQNKIWFHEGEECEILRAGSQKWQKGRFKINVTLEFIPDEPKEDTSPLDDVRQEINTNNTQK